jgi:hypothetical protein
MAEVFIPSFGRLHSAAVNSWATEDIRALKTLAQTGLSIGAIAAALHRSESAIRNKAGMHGISLQRTRGVRAAADSKGK